ncbi:MAG: AAA family ATPase [Phycisphaerae bacterium]|nr:AAA family ATPase [Phycisphaerae bacterium]
MGNEPSWPTVTPRQLRRLVAVCLRAGRGLLVGGNHGIGKSTILEEAAAELGYDVCVVDLSLLEAADLTGLPYREGNKTKYAKPVILPAKTKRGCKGGLLILEELNRCERLTRQPALQLLTRGTLNDYTLPKGWSVAACINRSDESGALYDVDELDPALLSRFACCTLVPSLPEWDAWAETAGINENVRTFVQTNEAIFQKTNPRAWAYLSELIQAAGDDGEAILLSAQATLQDKPTAMSFFQFHQGGLGTSGESPPENEDDLLKRIGAQDAKRLVELIQAATEELKLREGLASVRVGNRVQVFYQEPYEGEIVEMTRMSAKVKATADGETYTVPMSFILRVVGESK